MESQENKKNENFKDFNAWALAWELGFEIAIPLVLFALLVNTNGVVAFTGPTAENTSRRFFRAVVQ